MLKDFDYEINFSIDNKNKVLENNENLNIVFNTKSKINDDSTYYITITHKEMTLFSQQLEFNEASTFKMTIPSKEFRLINGGVLSLNLFRIIEEIIVYSDDPQDNVSLPPISTW